MKPTIFSASPAIFLVLLLALPLLIPSMISGPALAFGEGWIDDPAIAMERAVREKKDVIIDFTGSDWCGWCMKLVKEVFSHKEFSEEIQKDFVLLEIDFPAHKPQTDAIKERNKALSKKYGVKGFPIIVLVDSKGVEYARTGYRAGGPAAYLKHLKFLKTCAADLANLKTAAAAAKGMDRAVLLDAMIGEMDKLGIEDEKETLIKEIKDLDMEGLGGLKFKYASREKVSALLSSLKNVGDSSEADKVLAQLEKTLSGMMELLQEVVFYRAMIAMNSGDSAAAIGLLKRVVDLGPASEIGLRAAEGVKDLESAAPVPNAEEPVKK